MTQSNLLYESIDRKPTVQLTQCTIATPIIASEHDVASTADDVELRQ